MSNGSGTITHHLEGIVDLQGIVKGTVVRGDDLCPGGELRIADCHNVVIYALTPLSNASIFGCSDATIVIGEPNDSPLLFAPALAFALALFGRD